MTKAEKLRLKAETAKEFVDQVYKRKDMFDVSFHQAQGAVQTLEILFERQLGISKGLDDLFAKDEIAKDAYDAAKNTAGQMLTVTTKLLKGLEIERVKVQPKKEALDLVLQDLDQYYEKKMTLADNAEIMAKELEEEESDPQEEAKRLQRVARIEAKKKEEAGEVQPKDEKPPAAKKPASKKAPRKKPGPKPGTKRKTAAKAVGSRPSGDKQVPGPAAPRTDTVDAAGIPACGHCGDPVAPPTGSDFCTPCVSYRNRNKKLPPPEVLAKRKK